jgi:hypothetical protein
MASSRGLPYITVHGFHWIGAFVVLGAGLSFLEIGKISCLWWEPNHHHRYSSVYHAHCVDFTVDSVWNLSHWCSYPNCSGVTEYVTPKDGHLNLGQFRMRTVTCDIGWLISKYCKYCMYKCRSVPVLPVFVFTSLCLSLFSLLSAFSKVKHDLRHFFPSLCLLLFFMFWMVFLSSAFLPFALLFPPSSPGFHKFLLCFILYSLLFVKYFTCFQFLIY